MNQLKQALVELIRTHATVKRGCCNIGWKQRNFISNYPKV